MSIMLTCTACKICFNASLIVLCTICSNLCHTTLNCAGLSASKLKVLNLKKKQMLVYKCFDCHSSGRSSNLIDAQSLSSDLKDIKISCGIFSTLQVELADLYLHIDNISSSLKKLPRLKFQIDNVQERVSVFGAKDSSSPGYSEKFFSELQDRIERSNNGILFNLKEAVVDNADHDANLVEESLQPIGINLDAIHVKKIGERSNNSGNEIRLIIATLKSSRDVHTVFRNRSKSTHPIKMAFDKIRLQHNNMLILSTRVAFLLYHSQKT